MLSYLKEIPIITGYKRNGITLDKFDPTENLDACEPIVTTLPGWQTDISSCRELSEMPDEAKNYISYLEKALDTEIQFISVGANRNQYLIKGEWL